jgi:hypothetical protein
LGHILTVHLHLVRRSVKSVLRVLLQVKLPLGVIEVQLEVVELILQEPKHSDAVRNGVLQLLDQALEQRSERPCS